MRTSILTALICLMIAGQTPPASAMTLANGGSTSFSIVVAEDAIPSERYAAEELASYLGRMTGAQFPVITDDASPKGCRIIVGQSKLSKSLLGKDFLTRLGGEELVIRTIGSDLILAGGRPRGTLYAVYHFLDNILGVRWWATDATHIPHKSKLSIKSIDIRLKPRFEYRDVYTTTGWNPDWAARNRVNGLVHDNPSSGEGDLRAPDERHGGGVVYHSKFVCTFDKFIPESMYFKDHPEWFSLIDGKRVGGLNGGQLCLTNPEVLDLMVEKVKEELGDNPQVNAVSVSQNYGGAVGCQCSDCKKVDEEEGSQAGSLIRFVNAVAERIEKDCPYAAIDTFVYRHTKHAPKKVHTRPNVVVRVFSVDCSFAQPLTDPNIAVNRQFVEDLAAWAKVCDRVYAWDHVTNFHSYLRPHPNLRVLGPNIRFFASKGVKGVLEQGSFWTTGGEFQELRSWVLSRLLWNPQLDDNTLIDEFLKGYYGDAAPYIKEYIDLLHDLVPPGGDYILTTYGDDYGHNDPSPVINMESMYKAENLFRNAEAAVADQPEILNHVRRAHMPVQCMWLIHYNGWSAESKSKYYAAPTPMASIFQDFKAQLERDDVTIFGEQKSLTKLMSVLASRIANPLDVTASCSFRPAWPEDFWPEDSFDGNRSTLWEGGGMGPEWIRKDLGQVVQLKSIDTYFGPSWYYSKVRYKMESSLDGRTWQTVVADKTSDLTESVDILSPAVEARYIRTTILEAWAPDQSKQRIRLYEQTFDTSIQDK